MADGDGLESRAPDLPCGGERAFERGDLRVQPLYLAGGVFRRPQRLLDRLARVRGVGSDPHRLFRILPQPLLDPEEAFAKRGNLGLHRLRRARTLPHVLFGLSQRATQPRDLALHRYSPLRRQLHLTARRLRRRGRGVARSRKLGDLLGLPPDLGECVGSLGLKPREVELGLGPIRLVTVDIKARADSRGDRPVRRTGQQVHPARQPVAPLQVAIVAPLESDGRSKPRPRIARHDRRADQRALSGNGDVTELPREEAAELFPRQLAQYHIREEPHLDVAARQDHADFPPAEDIRIGRYNRKRRCPRPFDITTKCDIGVCAATAPAAGPITARTTGTAFITSMLRWNSGTCGMYMPPALS